MSRSAEADYFVPDVPSRVFVNIIPDGEAIPAGHAMRKGMAGLYEWDPTGDLQQYRAANDRLTATNPSASDDSLHHLMTISSSGGFVLCCESPEDRILIGRADPGNLGFLTNRWTTQDDHGFHVLACVHLDKSIGLSPERDGEVYETASELIKSNMDGTFAPIDDESDREVAYKLIDRLLRHRQKRIPGKLWE